MREHVIFRGQRFRATGFPLEYHPDCVVRLARFRNGFTACRRGYVGTWRIESEALYLHNLSAVHVPGRRSILARCFPEFVPGPTQAVWFSGWLHLSRPMDEGAYNPFRDMADELQVDLLIQAGTVVEKIERAVKVSRPKPEEFDSVPEFLLRKHD